MDLNLNDDQRMLQDMVARICEDLCDSAAVRVAEASEQGCLHELWQQLAELGLTGLTIDERYGGSETGLMSLAIVYEQFGRVLAPTPHWVSCVLAAALLKLGRNPRLADELLPGVAAGETVVTVAWLEAESSAELEGIRLQARPSPGGVMLHGCKLLVPYAGMADYLIVLARTDAAADAVGLFVVSATAEGVRISPQSNHAGEALFSVEFDATPVSVEQCLAEGALAWGIWQAAMSQALVALSAQAVGGTAAALEMSTAYAKERHAFDRPIGSFQAIAHYLADAATELESARVLTWQAAWAHDEGRDYQTLAAMAKLHACGVFRRATAMAVQIHGGMGFSLEADPQLYFRRAKQWQLMYWDPACLERRIAATVLPDVGISAVGFGAAAMQNATDGGAV